MNNPKWEVLKAGRSWSNESNGAEMAGCISEGGRVVAYLPNHFKDAPLLCAAPELLEALETIARGSAKDVGSNGLGVVSFDYETAKEIARAAIRKARGE